MLSKISLIDENGCYHLKNEDIPFKFVSVAQRLLSGRICIAGAALSQLHRILDEVVKYAESKSIPRGKNERMKLSELPLLRDEIDAIRDCLYVYKLFCCLNEDAFIKFADGLVTSQMVEHIACGKIEIVEYCIDKMLALKLRVGSYCLQSDSPFGSRTDILYVLRFAEGDTAILKQKMVRDCLKSIQRSMMMNVLLLIIGIPYYFLRHFMLNGGDGMRDGLQYKLNLNLLYLVGSMIGIDRSEYVCKWFESYKVIERIAKLKANLIIHDAVFPKLKGTKQFDSFKKHILSDL